MFIGTIAEVAGNIFPEALERATKWLLGAIDWAIEALILIKE